MPLLLVANIFTTPPTIAIDEVATATKLDNLYSTNFSATPFPSSLVFDPYEEYRHVVLDRTVTIMGNIMLQEHGNTNDQNDSIEMNPEQTHQSLRAQESQQYFDDIAKRLSLQSQQQQQLNEQLQLKHPEPLSEPIYPVKQASSPETRNQKEIVSKSSWFPSIPSYYCDGSYSFIIEGTAKLDLDKLKIANQYPVTIKILTDKLGVTSMDGNKEVAGELHIGNNQYIGDNANASDYNVRETDDVYNTNATNKFAPDIHNLDIQRIQNNCRIHVYNSK
jgi:osmotically-inducible protein OsmY